VTDDVVANDLRTRDREREALAATLHGTLLQRLIAAAWQVDAVITESGDSPTLEALRANLAALVDETGELIRELRAKR
jgi:signal transduction histidine kinase